MNDEKHYVANMVEDEGGLYVSFEEFTLVKAIGGGWYLASDSCGDILHIFEPVTTKDGAVAFLKSSIIEYKEELERFLEHLNTN